MYQLKNNRIRMRITGISQFQPRPNFLFRAFLTAFTGTGPLTTDMILKKKNEEKWFRGLELQIVRRAGFTSLAIELDLNKKERLWKLPRGDHKFNFKLLRVFFFFLSMRMNLPWRIASLFLYLPLNMVRGPGGVYVWEWSRPLLLFFLSI